MTKKRRKRSSSQAVLPVMRANAAGIDIGATEIYVAVPADRTAKNVRAFATFPQDLQALADWLQHCGIDTVAMESTGVYWIPLFQILETRGLEVCLVNARHVKNGPGRKSDVSDCQWLQFLHSGLLRASFRPEQEVCAVRALRHRESLRQMASTHVLHMQKALDQMNLQLHHVISDITGANRTGDCGRDPERRTRWAPLGEAAQPAHPSQ
jgi:transposase